MLAAVLIAVLAAPAPAPASPPPDAWTLGPLRLEQSTTLTWPGPYMPSFRVASDRRRVHRLSLGLDLPGLRRLSFDTVMVEASDDPDLRARTTRLQPNEGAKSYAWVGARMRLPGAWQLGIGRASTLGAAGARGSTSQSLGEWRLSLLLPLP